MCYAGKFDGNRVQVCTVGDLKPGQRYRDPDGHEFLVAEGKLIVRLDNGAVTCFNDVLEWTTTNVERNDQVVSKYRGDIKLGRDHKGRLYASRYLNQAPKTAATCPCGDPNCPNPGSCDAMQDDGIVPATVEDMKRDDDPFKGQ